MHDNDFRDKVVAVTGGGQGIGLCLVHTFAYRAARVAFCDVNAATGRHWERMLIREGLDVVFVKADLGRAADARKFVKVAVHAFGRADVLINNVGITDFGQEFLKSPLEEWNRIISVNLTSHFLCAQLFAPHLIKSRGCIINIASTRALMSEPNTEPYSASKGGIVALTHSLAITLGPYQTGQSPPVVWHQPVASMNRAILLSGRHYGILKATIYEQSDTSFQYSPVFRI